MITPRRGSVSIQVERLRRDARERVRDRVAAEEPMEIRLEVPGGDGPPEVHAVAVTMRTPGDDFELAAGFLFSEGLVRQRRDIHTIRYCTGPEEQEFNVVSVALRPGAPFDPTLLDRNFYTSSSCGVCGKASLEAVEVKGCTPFPIEAGSRWDPHTLRRLPDLLRGDQDVFQRTGGIHAAGLFRPGTDRDEPRPELVREDVGRHNAVDKVVGHLLLHERLPARDALLLVSGRTSFEILQKALTAGVSTVAAVGAPSSLAVELARTFGMTLLGFLGEEGFNVYAGGARIQP